MASVTDRAYEEARNKTLTREDNYFMQDPLDNVYSINDFPIKKHPLKSKTTHLTVAVRVMENVTSVDWMARCRSRDLADLPAPYGLAKAGLPAFSMQVYSKATSVGFTVMQVLSFPIRCNVSSLRTAFGGDVYSLTLTKGMSPRLTTHLFHFMGTRMGGPSLTNVLLNDPDKKPTRSQAEWRAGFMYIKQHGPIGTESNQNVEWTTLETNDPTSPIFNWPPHLVKESLRNLTGGKTVAASHSIYPLTLRDLKAQVLQSIVIPYLKVAAEHGLLLIGRSGIGKTPCSRIMSLALSDYYLHRDGLTEFDPSYRCGNDLDFFRSSPGMLIRHSIRITSK